MSIPYTWLCNAKTRDELATVYRIVAALRDTQPQSFWAEWERAFRRRAHDLGLSWKARK